jgi:hypothetical protein
MQDSRRFGPVSAVDGAVPHDHVCWLHEGADAWVSAAVQYLDEGARANDRLLYVADKDDQGLIGDLAQLPHRDELLETGQLRVLPLHDVHGTLDDVAVALHEQTQAAVRGGRRGLRLAAEVTPMAITTEASRRFIAHELLVDSICADEELTSLCGYDGELVSDAAIDLCFVHPLHRGGSNGDVVGTIHADHRGGWRVAGDIDLSNVDALTTALAALPTNGDVHLWLDALEFMAVGGARSLMELAGRMGPDSTLTLQHPPEQLRRILEVGWDPHPRVRMGAP